MKAALVREIGRPPEVAEVPEPRRGPGQALIEVTAAALNPIDVSRAAGTHYSGVPEVPYIPGGEGVGRVIEADTVPPGTRVRFSPLGGAMAERAVAAESGLAEVPDDVDDAVAASLGIAGLTAWLALEWRALLQKGETVLVLGATGAVGQIAVQAAKLLGAGRVVAAARDPQALERTRELGADATVRLGGGDDAAAMREAAGGEGPDIVVDPLWGDPARAAVEAAAPRARIVHIGETASPEATLRSGAVRGKLLSILGFALALTPADRRRDAYERLLDEAAAGRLIVQYETVPLDEVARAWALQSGEPRRKLVLVP